VGPILQPRPQHLSFREDDMWDPRTSIVLDVSQRGQEIERKRQVAQNQVSKKNPRKERFIAHRCWHIGPNLQQRHQRFKGGGARKKKANSQKLGVKNKSSKRNFYRTKRLTCGTHEPAASSTFLRRQAIEKRQIARN
jgi:hypothetical protein